MDRGPSQIIPAQTPECLLPELAAPGAGWWWRRSCRCRSLLPFELLKQTSVSSERRQDSSCPWNICGPVPRLTRWGRDLFVSGCLSRLAPAAAASERQALRASGGGRKREKKKERLRGNFFSFHPFFFPKAALKSFFFFFYNTGSEISAPPSLPPSLSKNKNEDKKGVLPLRLSLSLTPSRSPSSFYFQT